MTEYQYAVIERASIMRESGATYEEIGRHFGVSYYSASLWLRGRALPMDRTTRERAPRLVDVAPLREAFERSGETAAAVALRLGWVTKRGFGDGPRVRRVLGLRPAGNGQTQRRMQQRTGLAFCGALGLDPVDVDV